MQQHLMSFPEPEEKPKADPAEVEFWVREPCAVSYVAADGAEYCALVPLYGQLVNAAGEQHRAACEARVILRKPTKVDREALVVRLARKRGGAIEERVSWWTEKLKRDVRREWNWCREQRLKRDAKNG